MKKSFETIMEMKEFLERFKEEISLEELEECIQEGFFFGELVECNLGYNEDLDRYEMEME